MKLNNYKGADCGGGERVVACWVPRSPFEDLDYAEPMRIRAGMGRLLLMHGGIINIYIYRGMVILEKVLTLELWVSLLPCEADS